MDFTDFDFRTAFTTLIRGTFAHSYSEIIIKMMSLRGFR